MTSNFPHFLVEGCWIETVMDYCKNENSWALHVSWVSTSRRMTGQWSITTFAVTCLEGIWVTKVGSPELLVKGCFMKYLIWILKEFGSRESESHKNNLGWTIHLQVGWEDLGLIFIHSHLLSFAAPCRSCVFYTCMNCKYLLIVLFCMKHMHHQS